MKTFTLSLCLFASAAFATAKVNNKEECQTYIPELDLTCPTTPTDTPLTYAHPAHCSQYFECYNGCATAMACPAGLLYDEVQKWCGEAQKTNCGSRDCDGLEGMCAAVTPEPLDVSCDGRLYWSDEDNCSKFYQCDAEGEALQMLCPVWTDGETRLLWKEESFYCDFPENVECGSRPVCDENDDNCEVKPTAAPSDCPADACSHGDGLFGLAPCNACYCNCVGGAAFEQCCPDGLVWDDALKICNWPSGNPAC